jgi:hypothetical protein
LDKFIWAFIIGGSICVIGQILMDVFRLTPAHTMCTLVVIGAVLGGLGWYDPLIKFAGAEHQFQLAVLVILLLREHYLKQIEMVLLEYLQEFLKSQVQAFPLQLFLVF